jgi:hypothetical protein
VEEHVGVAVAVPSLTGWKATFLTVASPPVFNVTEYVNVTD